ncbi:putative nucleotide-binding alpha-beta plait domain superfamily, RNA-binding domain superfamily [Helianthus annuus]|nr:putative nucleotide-binding alpha-beta plait domain superfamily, RNA-binding domain superfamily [Helianthus annuus]
MKKKQKFVEFYDTRAATKAVAAVNSQEINGKLVVVEFVRPNGHNNNNNNKLIPDSPPREVKPLPCRKSDGKRGEFTLWWCKEEYEELSVCICLILILYICLFNIVYACVCMWSLCDVFTNTQRDRSHMGV